MFQIKTAIKKIYHLLPEPPSTNYLYRKITPNPYDLLAPAPVIFDIGSKEARGSYAFGTPPRDAKVVCVGGIIYINVPFIFPFHADPDDFYRFSYQGIKILCEDFECIDSGFNRGPASTMHHLLVHFMAILFCFNNKTLYGINVDAFQWLFFWIKYLDKFVARYQVAYVIHAGSYFIGRKPAPSDPGLLRSESGMKC